MTISSTPKSNSFLFLLLLIVICLIPGMLTFKDFGTSWDEPGLYEYGRDVVTAYVNPAIDPTYFDHDGDLKYYGPAYLVSTTAVLNLFGWSGKNIHHLFIFFTYLLGICSFLVFLNRWFSPLTSFAATILFASQPLLWGHAFMNPKDIPFMAFFITSLTLGFHLAEKIASLQSWRLWLFAILAGLVLGYTISIRIIGPFAGVMVSMYLIYQKNLRTIPILLLYWLSAFITTYLSWPYLWPDPLNRFISSFRVMRSFPWSHEVLFDGRYYSSTDLPWYYLPKLISLQFTEPVLIFFIAGMMILLINIFQKKIDWVLPTTILFWFFLPLGGVLFTQPTMYDNFRQFFFMLPPIFILSAYAFHKIFAAISSPILRILVIILSILPSFQAIALLHPYEYVYYNSLAGPIDGQYETDYWATSFDEAADYINATAPTNAVVSIGPWKMFQRILRPDLQIDLNEISASSDYVLVFSRWEYDKNPAFNGEPVFTIGRSGAVFLTVQRIP